MICFYTEIAKILTRFSTIFSLFVLTFVNSLLVIYQFLCYTKYNYNKIGGIIIGKTTMKDIADALNISRVTVSKAFNNQMGVSDSLRELIFEKARELGYSKLPYLLLQLLCKILIQFLHSFPKIGNYISSDENFSPYMSLYDFSLDCKRE